MSTSLISAMQGHNSHHHITSSNPYTHRPFYFFPTEWFCRAEIKRKFISICLPSDHWSQTSDNFVAALKLKEASRTGKEKKEKVPWLHCHSQIMEEEIAVWENHGCFEGREAGDGDCGLTWLLVYPTQKTQGPQSPNTLELWSWNSILVCYTVVVKGDLNCFKHIKFIRKYQVCNLNIVLPSPSH